jgi:hypothetical protein
MAAKNHNPDTNRPTPTSAHRPPPSDAIMTLARLLGRAAAREYMATQADGNASGNSDPDITKRPSEEEQFDD